MPIKIIDLPNKSFIKIKELSFFVIYENGIFFVDLFPIWIFPEPLKLLFFNNWALLLFLYVFNLFGKLEFMHPRNKETKRR